MVNKISLGFLKKLFVIFMFVTLISFVYSLPVPPPVPSMDGGNNSTYTAPISTSTSTGSGARSILNKLINFFYSSESASEGKRFLGDWGTLFLAGEGFSWAKFFWALFFFFILLTIIVILVIKRKKDLLTKNGLVKSDGTQK